jgi:hypothetical protein
MIECGRRFRLLNKTAHAVLVCSKVSRQNLQRHFAIEFCVLGQIHFTHSTGTDFRDDAVVGEISVGGESRVIHPYLKSRRFTDKHTISNQNSA